MESSVAHPDKSLPDKWLFLFAYPVVALLAVHVGNDNTVSHLLTLPSYYTDLLLSFSITYAIGLYLHWLYQKLNRDPGFRLNFLLVAKVLVAGLVIPVLFALIGELIYLRLIGIPLEDSSVFYLELPVVIMCCALFNLVYLLLLAARHKSQDIQTAAPEENFLSEFNASIGNKVVRLSNGEVAYFMIRDRMTFLVTTEGKRFLYDESLENISKNVNPHQYFQLNRQFLARRSSVRSATPTETRRLDVQLEPAPEQPVFVAKNKASLFLSWLKEN